MQPRAHLLFEPCIYSLGRGNISNVSTVASFAQPREQKYSLEMIMMKMRPQTSLLVLSVARAFFLELHAELSAPDKSEFLTVYPRSAVLKKFKIYFE